MPCIVCGQKNKVAGHHLKSVGSGGDDIEENLIPLCFVHHAEVHQIALIKFCQKYTAVKYYILERNWYYDDNRQKYLNDNVYNCAN